MTNEWTLIAKDDDEFELRRHLEDGKGYAVAIDGDKRFSIIEHASIDGYYTDEDTYYSGYLRNHGFWAYILIPKPTPAEDHFFIDGRLFTVDKLAEHDDGVGDMAREIIRLHEELAKYKGNQMNEKALKAAESLGHAFNHDIKYYGGGDSMWDSIEPKEVVEMLEYYRSRLDEVDEAMKGDK